MTYLMLCDHKRSKLKLIAWAATDRQYGRRQGFKRVKCCKTCGCVVKDK